MKLDAYGFRAQAIPAIIAFAAPISFIGTFITWNQFHVSQLLAPIISAVVLTMLADFASRQGQRIQPAIFTAMGGMPSVALLRHRDTRIHHSTKTRFIEWWM